MTLKAPFTTGCRWKAWEAVAPGIRQDGATLTEDGVCKIKTDVEETTANYRHSG